MIRVATVAVVLFSVVVTSACATSLELDLLTGQLNGRFFTEYTLDDITELLGRPSAVRNPQTLYGTMFGPRLKYHGLGLRLWFAHPDVDPQRHCREFAITLVPQYDDEDNLNYEAFPGHIVQDVTGDWRASQVLELLSPYGGEDLFDSGSYEEIAALHDELVELGAAEISSAPECHTCCIALESELYSLALNYEYNTRFMETVSLHTRVPVSSMKRVPDSESTTGGAIALSRGRGRTEIAGGFSHSNVSFSSRLDGYVEVTGEMTNNSGSDHTAAFFLVSLYDESGRLLNVGTVGVPEFANGQTKSFWGPLEADLSGVARFKIQFEGGM